jgi:hypothetical protein
MAKKYVVITWNLTDPIQPQLAMDPQREGVPLEFPSKHHAHAHVLDMNCEHGWYYKVVKLSYK